LWHARFGNVPRYATAAAAQMASQARQRAQTMAAESASAGQADVVFPGHGAVAAGPEVAARLAVDHAYIDALRRGEEPVDPRLGRTRTGSPAPTSRTWSRPEGGFHGPHAAEDRSARRAADSRRPESRGRSMRPTDR